MNTILFIPYHLESHIRPTFVLRNVLQEKYRTVYALPKKFEWLADANQLEYYNLESVPFGYGFEQVMRIQEGSKKVWRDSLHDRRNRRISKHREKKLLEVVNAVKPCFIILDMLSATDFILLYQWVKENDAGIAILNPMLSTYTHKGVPRIGSLLSPANSFKLSMENRMVRLMYNVFNAKEFIQWLGNGNRSLIKRELKSKRIPAQYKLARKNYVANFFNEIPELIVAPEELEFFSGNTRANQHYIGLLPAVKNIRDENQDEYRELFENIARWKKNAGTRIIYCAFGSMHGPANSIIASFLQRLFAARVNKYGLKIICAFADTENLLDKNSLPENVYVYDRLPQTELLPLCDLFITHAGLGSIKEAIAAGIPMLAYPFTRHWDSTGNAVKIECHGLGLKGDIAKDSTGKISERISVVLNDPECGKRVRELRDIAGRKYSKEKVLALFDKFIANKIG